MKRQTENLNKLYRNLFWKKRQYNFYLIKKVIIY